MPRYKYTAFDPRGYKVSNTMNAPSEKVCRDRIIRNNLKPLSIKRTINFNIGRR